jgi:hypothetical protein
LISAQSLCKEKGERESGTAGRASERQQPNISAREQARGDICSARVRSVPFVEQATVP